MISGDQIAQGAITDSKVGKNAKIKHSKLERAKEGEILVAQDDGKLKAVRLTGDVKLSRSGKLTIKIPDVPDLALDESFLRKTDIKQGKTLVGGKSKPEEVVVGTGANAIPQRDASGNLTADNLSVGTATTTTVGTQTTTTQSHPNIKLTEVVSGTDGSGPNPQQQFTVVHNFGYIPLHEVYKIDGDDVIQIEPEVISTTELTTVKFLQTIGTIPASNVARPDIKLILR